MNWNLHCFWVPNSSQYQDPGSQTTITLQFHLIHHHFLLVPLICWCHGRIPRRKKETSFQSCPSLCRVPLHIYTRINCLTAIENTLVDDSMADGINTGYHPISHMSSCNGHTGIPGLHADNLPDHQLQQWLSITSFSVEMPSQGDIWGTGGKCR